jgi:small subunit ribosomal protein S17
MAEDEQTTTENVDETAADVTAEAPEQTTESAPPAPQEVLAPKERRARARAAKAAKAAKARTPRTPEERQAERLVVRATKAKERRAGRAKAAAKYKAEAHNRTATPAREQVAGSQKVRQGVVVSDKADKTITVRIDTARRHRRYEKIVRTSQTLHAHDESNDAHIGDTVTVREARPLSRTKRWRLVGVVERAR